MKAFVCDLCGRFFTEKRTEMAMTVSRVDGNFNLNGRAAKLYDVCPTCVEDFRNWIQARRQEQKSNAE